MVKIIVQASGLDMQYFLGNCSECWNNSLRRAQLSDSRDICIFLRISCQVLKERYYVAMTTTSLRQRCIGRTKRPKELRKPAVRLAHNIVDVTLHSLQRVLYDRELRLNVRVEIFEYVCE